MPLPLAHGLVGATVIAALREDFSFRKDWRGLSLGAALAIIPDFDLILSWVLGYSVQTHGGFTHSIMFSMAIGLLACLLMRERNVRGFTVYALATLSHGILDVATRKEYGGSALLWPFSSHKFRLGWFDYFEFYPDPATEPIIVILRNALEVCRYETMIFTPVFLIVVWCRPLFFAVLRGLADDKSIGQRLQGLGLSSNEAKDAVKTADQEIKESKRQK